MSKLNHVQVKIMDETMILQGVESVEYIRTIADYINMKAEKLLGKSQGALIGQSLKQLLIVINITDELFQEQEKVKKLEQQLAEARQELDEYIEAFDKNEKPKP